MTTISFEFFPPKSDKAQESLLETAQYLDALNPLFFSVTYGAGGSTQDGTTTIANSLMEKVDADIAAHLTFINTDISKLKEYVDTLWESGIKRLVALRGDLSPDLNWPLDPDGNYFQYTSDFVEALLEWHAFDISVGAYPEKHPDAPSMKSDLIALKKKCDAGAHRAITQFFFGNDIFYSFCERVHAMQIDTPMVPGLLPIHDFDNMVKFAKRCEATVPLWVHEKFENKSDEDRKKVAQEILNEQVSDFVKQGVPHIHFYTLNKDDMVIEACRQAGL